MTHRDAHAATEFLRPFIEAADRLANHGIVVSRLHTDWASFGSWVLEAERVGRHAPVVRATWDGRDGALEIAHPGVSAASLERFDSPVAALDYLEGLLIAGLGA